MRNVVKLVTIWLGAALAATACAKGATGVELGEGGSAGSTTGSPTTGAGNSGNTTGAGNSGNTTGASSSGSATTSGSSGTASGSSGTSSSGTASGGSSTTTSSSTGGGNMACIPVGDLSVMGTAGPCNANQNCPTTSFTAVVSGAPGPLVDVDVSLEAIAAETDQNILSLKSPQGTVVTLFNQHGNLLTNDFFGTMFDDEAAQSVASAPGPFHGCFKPDQALSAFQGQIADGTWTLQVRTCLFQTTVNSWTLHLDF